MPLSIKFLFGFYLSNLKVWWKIVWVQGGLFRGSFGVIVKEEWRSLMD